MFRGKKYWNIPKRLVDGGCYGCGGVLVLFSLDK